MIDFFLVTAGLALLYAGGELLVRGAVAIGLRCGLSPLVTGLTIVAFGTSAPELAVSIDAAVVGSTEIAIANVVGSNFANIALVLALSALLVPIAIDRKVLYRDIPVMLGGFVISILMLLDGEVGLLDGALLLAGLVGYIGFVISHSRSEYVVLEDQEPGAFSLTTTVFMLIGGVAVLVLGGHFLVEGAVHIASSLGVSEAVIGMTVVAVGTSLPEITASLVSIIRGHSGMAVGNVVGSNIWNTFGVLGVTSSIIPLQQGQVSALMLGTMVGAGVVLWVFCRTRSTLSRVEGGIMLAGYIACQTWLFL